MDRPLLKLLVSVGLASGCLGGCEMFDDPSLELDPALARDSTLLTLSASEGFPVSRKHILESFGSFGCASCPGAEAKLSPYIHAEPGSPRHAPNLVVLNYHVAFSIADAWITPGTQARYDESFANSLPQVTLDGSNAQFGIREKDVRAEAGEYDSLIARIGRIDSLSYLDLVLDTEHSRYDSASQNFNAHFFILNRGASAFRNLSLRVSAVKNLPVTGPVVTGSLPWEVVVAETTDKDALGRPLIQASLPALTAKAFSVSLRLPPESGKHQATPPLGEENPRDYALVITVADEDGVVRNVFFRRYEPKPPTL